MNQNSIAAMAETERPQERLENLGSSSLSDCELLSIILRSGNKSQNVLQLSQALLSQAGSLYELVQWSIKDFQQIKGIGKVKSAQLVTMLELVRRILMQSEDRQIKSFDDADSVYRYFRPRIQGISVEKFYCLLLNRKNHLIRCEEVTSGTVSSSLVHPREVYREAIRYNASAIIAAHNHPSGDPQPSNQDFMVTNSLAAASKTIKISLLDHVIVTNNAYYSFAENGLLNQP